jgi:Aldo/keto reductase family
MALPATDRRASRGRARRRCDGWGSRRSISTSSTAATPRCPAELIGALRDLLDAGKIRMAGVSNATIDQIRIANDVLDGRLVSVQNQLSPAFRSREPELRLCEDLGVVSCRGARSGASPTPRLGRRVLVAVPVLAAGVPALALRTEPAAAVAGVLLWGAVLGIQESTMRAAVADLVPAARRGTAYGIVAAGFGLATLAAGLLAGALYDRSVPALVAVVVVVQAGALVALPGALRAARAAPGSA